MLRRSPEGSTYISAEDYEGAPSSSGGGHPGGGGGGGPHPSFCFYAPKDLSLSDDCPFVLLEHTEQQPVIINNPGMALRITRYVRPLQQQHQQQTAASSANPSNQQDRIRAEEERLQVKHAAAAANGSVAAVGAVAVVLESWEGHAPFCCCFGGCCSDRSEFAVGVDSALDTLCVWSSQLLGNYLVSRLLQCLLLLFR